MASGDEEESILPAITATVTHFDGMDYRSITSMPTEDQKMLKRVEEGAAIPQTTIRTQENLVRLHKRGRMPAASDEVDPVPAAGSVLCDAAPDRARTSGGCICKMLSACC